MKKIIITLVLTLAAALAVTIPALASSGQQIAYLGHGTIPCWEYQNRGWHVNLAPVSTTGNISVTCQSYDWLVFPKSSGEEIMKIVAPDGATSSYNIWPR